MADSRPTRAQLAAALSFLVGATCLVSISLGWAFPSSVPTVLRYLNQAGAIIEIIVAIGLLRRQRAAWAFALSLEGTLTLVNLLGLPYLLKAGLAGQLSVGLVVARLLLLIMLPFCEKEVSSAS